MKIHTLPAIAEKVKEQPARRVVFMSGVFDLFHFGHFTAIKKAATLGDILVVQIDGNALVKQRKGPDRPYLDQDIRADIISSLTFVDFVYISDTPSEDVSTLIALQPSVFVRAKIAQETEEERMRRETDLRTKSPNTSIVWLDQTKEISTTKIMPVLHTLCVQTTETHL